MPFFLIIIMVIAILLALFFLQFYRDPERKIPKDLKEGDMLSPADGWVISVIDLKKSRETIKLKTDKLQLKKILEGTTQPRYIIQIYLSPFDCHMTRSPVNGTITKITNIPGKLTNAFRKDAIKNERVEFLIQTNGKAEKETIKMLMVGAPLVHKIKKKVKENQKVKPGQRLAQFLWRSQVTLVLPDMKFSVNVGQHVRAGETVLGNVTKVF